MKQLLTLMTILLGSFAEAQDNKPVIFNPSKNSKSEMDKNIYQYPSFIKGYAFYKNGNVASSLFNYNYFTNQINFIEPGGDTLALRQPGEFTRITIETDTFCFDGREFVRQVTHHPSYNLFVKRRLKNSGSERKGGYGSYSGTTSVTSVNTAIVDTEVIHIPSDENFLYNFQDLFYVSGKYGQFYPATKKGLNELFGKHQKQLKVFLEENKIDLNNQDQLQKLLDWGRSLLN